MGLTLHFSLSLPATTPRNDVVERFRQLRAAATQLPFDGVGPLTTTSAGEALGDSADDALSYLFRLWSSLQLDQSSNEGDDEILPDSVGFAIIPGVQSEPAMFGLAWVPPRDDQWRSLTDRPPSWFWHCSCKTQYASNESDEHFVKCHTALVALLDEAVKIGLIVEVDDEGGYWESRDVSRLLAQLGTMNRLVARLGGALHDAIGPEHSVEAPIFEHPDFEHLEMDD